MDQDRIAAARSLVAAPLIVTLAQCYPALAEKIRGTMKPEWEHVGELTIMDPVLKPYTLHLRVSQVPRGYHLEILIPEGYEASMREKFVIFRGAMQLFWEEWRIINAELAAEIFGVGSDAQKLCLTETACYWRAENEYWLGIIGYFTDAKGKLFRVADEKK